MGRVCPHAVLASKCAHAHHRLEPELGRLLDRKIGSPHDKQRDCRNEPLLWIDVEGVVQVDHQERVRADKLAQMLQAPGGERDELPHLGELVNGAPVSELLCLGCSRHLRGLLERPKEMDG